MADVKVIIDGNEYSEEEFRKDLIRMLDAYRDKDAQMGVPECSGVECYVCPLYKNSCCKRRTTNSFKTIGLVYEWAIEHPVKTNRDKLEEVFGVKVVKCFITNGKEKTRVYKFSNEENKIIKLFSLSLEDTSFIEWLDDEYKETEKND